MTWMSARRGRGTNRSYPPSRLYGSLMRANQCWRTRGSTTPGSARTTPRRGADDFTLSPRVRHSGTMSQCSRLGGEVAERHRTAPCNKPHGGGLPRDTRIECQRSARKCLVTIRTHSLHPWWRHPPRACSLSSSAVRPSRLGDADAGAVGLRDRRPPSL